MMSSDNSVDFASHDRYYMECALRLGARMAGASGENPAVGCVIVASRHDRPCVVGRGWTGQGGRPHAERMALERAGAAARGASVYVTLEPCAHHGRTPSCAKALIKAGVARVASAMEDPDPRVCGCGHAMLKAAGIAVTTGILAEEAARAHEGFIFRITCRRPHVSLKLALSADHRIAARPGEATAITSGQARKRVHLMRARCDAVMVGYLTALIDDPLLTCRLPGMEDRSPARIVLAGHGGIDATSRLVRSARKVPLWVGVTPDVPKTAIMALEQAGADILLCPRGAQAGLCDLSAVLAELARRGVGRLLVEGGAMLADAFLSEGLVDEVALFHAPIILGVDGVKAPAALTADMMKKTPMFALVEEETYGRDRLCVYKTRLREGKFSCLQVL
ncbi:MAG: bifunctional diaminohydroxyphosphoribosylaminopyrimidine deaminase/5-amino-6-(5-phosphoribosylamino)uracil reductase RibD [Hyphomicrobiales bacterium]